jgi:Spy/CpxP family protein refolding chaperone
MDRGETAVRKLLVISLLLFTWQAAGQDLPPGRWWRNAQVAEKLALSAQQQEQLDDIFQASANELIDRRGEMEKALVALRAELDQNQPNRGNLQRLAARLSDARGKLFERELMMLADMRGALTDEQWSKLRQHARQREGDRRPMQRRRQ